LKSGVDTFFFSAKEKLLAPFSFEKNKGEPDEGKRDNDKGRSQP
jgi:hypothetical protein